MRRPRHQPRPHHRPHPRRQPPPRTPTCARFRTCAAPIPEPASASASAPAPERAPTPPQLDARLGATAAYDTPLDAFSFGLLGQLDWRHRFAFRLSAHFGRTEHTVDPDRRAKLRLIGVETSVCPRFVVSGAFSLYPCAAFDVGSLRVEGVQGGRLTSGSSATILWVAIGPGLRAAWEPESPFWLELHGRLAFPLVRHEFIFEQPQASVFKVDPFTSLSAGAGLAAGVRFW